MAKRISVSPSMRWSVFSRDGFTCRYCGAQAGQEGVELHADHVKSVSEGGDNSFDNLLTACQKCNGGKGARSIPAAPTSEAVIERINERTRLLKAQAKSIQGAIAAQRNLEQSAVDLKCSAYGVQKIIMEPGEKARILAWCREFGSERVLEWYSLAASRDVYPNRAIRYVSGIARNVREKEGTDTVPAEF